MDVVGDSSDSSSQMSGGDFMEINVWSLVKSSQDAWIRWEIAFLQSLVFATDFLMGLRLPDLQHLKGWRTLVSAGGKTLPGRILLHKKTAKNLQTISKPPENDEILGQLDFVLSLMGLAPHFWILCSHSPQIQKFLMSM